MLLNSFTTALALAGSAVANPFPQLHPRQAATLQAAFIARNRSYVGTSLTIRNDNTEQNIIKSEFNSITPENAMKWDATEPSQNNFQFSAGDQIVNWAQQNGNKQVRCHTLVWYSQLPSWVNNINNNQTLLGVMENHINKVMGRWKGKCTHWDVVNEALEENGQNRNNVFQRVIGDAYIPIAFRMAAAADPAAKLYYNDYNLEYGGDKHKGAIRIVKLVQSYGIKIDGVGLQGHMVSEPTGTQSTVTPSVAALTQTLQDYANLGVDVAYTELDVRAKTPINSQKLADSAAAWGRLAQSCINVSRCIGFTVWGISDKYSWVPSTFSGEDNALLWDGNLQKKSSYQAVLDVFNGKVAS